VIRILPAFAVPLAGPRSRRAALIALACLLLSPAGGGPAGMPEHPPKSSQAYGSGKILKPEFDDLVKHADLIVLGKITQIGAISHPGPSKSRPASRKYTYWESSFALLNVEETIKGKAPKSTLKVAFHSDLEDDKTNYQTGKKYIAFLSIPTKYPDSYTTTHFHYGEYKINDQGKAERVGDFSEISKPAEVLIENIRKSLGPPGKGR
jgi:hypothetical protein